MHALALAGGVTGCAHFRPVPDHPTPAPDHRRPPTSPPDTSPAGRRPGIGHPTSRTQSRAGASSTEVRAMLMDTVTGWTPHDIRPRASPPTHGHAISESPEVTAGQVGCTREVGRREWDTGDGTGRQHVTALHRSTAPRPRSSAGRHNEQHGRSQDESDNGQRHTEIGTETPSTAAPASTDRSVSHMTHHVADQHKDRYGTRGDR
jgi:hypothetical protein